MSKKKKILVIDDDEFMRKLYTDFLTKKGYEVDTAVSAEDVVERYLQEDPWYDLILCDIMMAKMDGWQFISIMRKDIRKGFFELPIIVFSAHFDSDLLRAEALGRGANGAYSKSEPLSKLLHLVKVNLGEIRSKYHV